MRSSKTLTFMSLIMGLAILCVFLYPHYHKFLPDLNMPYAAALTDQQIQEIRRHTPITEIQVFKAKRELYLLHQDQVVRRYPMRLGFQPIGHKTQEGDGKTPEGRYTIDWRNPNSLFYKSLHISYPNKQDLAQAKARGVSAGGDVMIHGSTNSETAKLPKMMDYMPNKDWTWGCVAVTNNTMDEIWKLVDNGTAIALFP